MNVKAVFLLEAGGLMILLCLNLLLLMVWTWLSTRCCPVLRLLSDGSASEVSSPTSLTIAERSGSGTIIFPGTFPCPSTQLYYGQQSQESEKAVTHAATLKPLRRRGGSVPELEAEEDSTLETAPARGVHGQVSSAGWTQRASGGNGDELYGKP